MRLSKQNLNLIKETLDLSLPSQHVFQLPEKVLQFGTGVFIRGLIDYYIDTANNGNIFNGRIVMVKSTDAGDTQTFREQDCLYTLLMKSVNYGVDIEEKKICAAISRVLDAKKEWNKVLATASNPELQVIISNTTEVGIALVEEDRVTDHPPSSFPGKLLAILLQRYRIFDGAAGSGFVIIPTELIPDNGLKLKTIINQLAFKNELKLDFIKWLNDENDFCNSLVDRIVPGKLPAADQRQMEKQLGYEDQLMIMAETFGLWAIETDVQRSKEIISFSKANPGIHIVPDIEKFRELKLRLLNGSHNLSCAIGVLAGFNTVKEAMANTMFDSFMQRLILEEITAAILSKTISAEDAQQFGSSVLERYRNPYIEFEWLSICVQDTSKIKIRAVPIVLQHHNKYGFVPDGISMGFAAYILFMHSEKDENGEYVGRINLKNYTISDDFAAVLYHKWKDNSGMDLVKSILQDEELWGADLFALNGFAEGVLFYLQQFNAHGFFNTVSLSFHETNPIMK